MSKKLSRHCDLDTLSSREKKIQAIRDDIKKEHVNHTQRLYDSMHSISHELTLLSLHYTC